MGQGGSSLTPELRRRRRFGASAARRSRSVPPGESGRGFHALRRKFLGQEPSSSSAKAFRDLVSDWPSQDLACLVAEQAAAAALRRLADDADAARPPAPHLPADLARLFDSGVAADTRLRFRDAEFRVHGPLLRARCRFFRRLLPGEPSQGSVVPVELGALDVGGFRALLRYLYSGEVDAAGRPEPRLRQQLGVGASLSADLEKLLSCAEEGGDAVLMFVSSVPATAGRDSPEEEAARSPVEPEVETAEEEAEDGTVSAREEMAVWRQGLGGSAPAGSRSRPLSLTSAAEFRCHSAVLAARSPLLAGLVERRMDERRPIRIQLDEAVIPRLYAPVLLHALYTDRVDLSKMIRNCPIPINSLTEVQAIAAGKCQVAPIDEATEVFHIARFLAFPRLAQGCESLIVGAVGLESLAGVFAWASEADGSPFVRRHCVAFLVREFGRVSASPALGDLEEPLLRSALASDNVQASELEILNAVVRWGEQTLMRRLEEREPNLIASTTHSISRKGIRRSDLSDSELREILVDLMPLVRTDFVLPPFHPALVSAISRGLVSRPPADLPGTARLRTTASESVIEGRGLGNPDAHWLHADDGRRRRTARPRAFVPYAQEARRQLQKRLAEAPETKLLCHSPPSLAESRLPDMLRPSSSTDGGQDSASSSDAEEEPVCATRLEAVSEAVSELLRTSPVAAEALSCGCAQHRRAVLRQLRLRCLREAGCPDSALRLLRRGDWADPLGPLEALPPMAAADAQASATAPPEAWPDLMSSASLGRGERSSSYGAELRAVCADVGRWSVSTQQDHKDRRVSSLSESRRCCVAARPGWASWPLGSDSSRPVGPSGGAGVARSSEPSSPGARQTSGPRFLVHPPSPQNQAGPQLTEVHRLLAKYRKPELWTRVLGWSWTELTEALGSESVRPIDVLCAFLSKALEAHAATNCLCGILVSAEARALSLEVEFAGKTKPALFGVPVSLKENIGVGGLSFTGGYARLLSEAAPVDSDSVALLLGLGAVPFVRTNVPQALFVFLAANPIYGATSNPHDSARSSGGSSGGEGALIGFGGSPLGLGGDIAGSIRLPAHWNGVAGLRPTTLRFTQRGNRCVAPGIPVVGNSGGPLAVSADALVAFFRAAYAAQSPLFRDPFVHTKHFDEAEYGSERNLRIGFYEEDGWFPATPACRRAVREAAAKLEAAGHELVPWQPVDVAESFRLLISICLNDGGRFIRDSVALDLPEPLCEWLYSLIRVPAWRRSATAAGLRLRGDWRRALLLQALPSDTTQLREAYGRTKDYRYATLESWRAAGLDAVLCPPCATVALPQEAVMPAFPIFSYTALFNVLDFPGGVVPITKVSAEDEEAMGAYPERDPQERLVKGACSAGTLGLPVGVQIAALPYQEETVLRLMRELEA